MQNFFQTVSRQMEEEIKTIGKEILHSGMKGNSGEEIIRQFLKKYLPKKFSIAQGKVVDFAGNESRQIDIIIYDAFHTIPFYTDETNSIIPVENVCAVIEVKTVLNKAKLIESLGVFQSIFHLQTPSEYQILTRGNLIIKDLTIYNKYKLHPKCFIFGLNASKSTSVETLMHNYFSFVKERHIKFPLVSFCGVLNDKFFIDILNEEKAEEAENPCDIYLNNSDGNTLLLFLLNLVGLADSSTLIRKPDFSLYLAYYKNINNKEKLSDGWLIH